MIVSPPRTTAHTSTLQPVTRSIWCRGVPSSFFAPPVSRISTSSTTPLAKRSRRRKPGYFKSLSISAAVLRSGFTVSDRANRSRLLCTVSEYSGVRMRAIVCRLSFMPCAVMQHKRFVSSEPVAAISRFACCTSACRSVSIEAQLPAMDMTSYWAIVFSRMAASESMSVMSWPSFANCRVSHAPTLPSPAMRIFIGVPPGMITGF